MIIKLSPDANMPLDFAVTKTGDLLNINGEDYDFSPMKSGDTLPFGAVSGGWFRGDIERTNDGNLIVTLALPNGPNASPAQRFPVDLVNVPDGAVLLPQPLPEREAVEIKGADE